MFKKFWKSIRRFLGFGRFNTVTDLAMHYHKNVDGLAYWLEQNITYTKDMKPEDSWQPAAVTLSRRKGDCEDYAILGFECLKVWGWPACIMCMWPASGVGHAVCLFRKPGFLNYYCFDNGALKELKARDTSDVMPELRPGWTKLKIVRSC